MGRAVTQRQQASVGTPGPTRWPGPFASRALAIAVAASATLFVLQWIALRTTEGQKLDERSFADFQQRPWSHLNLPGRVLGDVSAGTAVVACVVIGAIALIRWRRSYAVAAIVLVVGANVTVQALKHVVLERTAGAVIAPNSFPSGHVCIVASLVLAALLVLPAALRPAFAIPGAIWITAVAVSTLLAAWHRVSDIVAALLVCLAWAALTAAVLGWRRLWLAGRAGPAVVWWLGCLAAVGLTAVLGALAVVSPAADVGSGELIAVASSVVLVGVSSAAVTAIWCRLLSALAATEN